ncbi:thiamine ABC transporter substrate binding subunit [Candidatus Liberibacter asiaticus]|uniref:Thiamine-binding periplasmic protein n=3 Tax=Liberibacter asiaticus TaxID=34021 RepID=C6XF82_LIBAP|nr:thiamine ABC transporter substrate binding subunit [Candidatus Liberibacter asiaticus]ACT57034.1 thiamine transporter substrate binding subunit [Candidatus Liberibacter asiaticus str. psy62]AGH17000.1 thiamine transporter substrate binding subunit [Candidatus Liberibacter asiaticus str. gxpsy]ALK07788.2 thiamine ABC transporter substrate binding subunit [Candidatus Liberibacter asiaticus]ASK52825.1 thiamine transporter substrate binding subunit [Candidatus Liberibacter asiaticus]AWL14141.1 
MKKFARIVVGIMMITGVISYCTLDGLPAKPVLTVYTYNSFVADEGAGPKIKQAFERKCNCELKLIGLSDGVALLNKLRMEGENSAADIVLGFDNNLIDLARKTGLFAKSNIDASQLKLPIKWDDDIFVPYDYGYLAFIYDKRQITQPPKNFDELINSTKPWKIIYQDPRTSTLGLGLLLWIQKIYGDNSAQVWKKIATKTATVTKGWTESYGFFLKGESDFVLSYSTSPGFYLLNYGQDDYVAALFSEGHYLQIEVAAQLVRSKQPQLAQEFMQFMISPSFQRILPTTNWMYPVVDISMPDVYQAIRIPQKSLRFNAEETTRYRNQWISSWQNAVSRL